MQEGEGKGDEAEVGAEEQLEEESQEEAEGLRVSLE